MDIAVHGTKGGCDIFTPKKLSGLFDVGLGEGVAALGQQAYAISFKDNNIIFSKYEIIKDVRGDKRTGFIAYSVFLPKNEKLSGSEIRSLLDRISNEYRQKYIVENNLYDVREDWAFLDDISRDYEQKPRFDPSDSAEILQSGPKEAAYIYYNDIEELQKYFNNPVQEVYSPFKQVLFVKHDLKGKPTNPLNALKHDPDPISNLTGKVDLENPWFKLKEYHGQGKNGISIEIRANGRLRNNKDKIFKKDNISIKYSKNKYYEEIYEEGKLSDYKIAQYLIIDEIFEKIEVRKDVDLPEVSQPISFEIKDRNELPIFNSEIQIGNQSPEKVIGHQFTYTFKGEKLKELWTISGKKEEFEGKIEIVPENAPRNIPLILEEYRKVTIIAHEDTINGDILKNITISVPNKIPQNNQIVFVGDEITRDHTIIISSQGYLRFPLVYCPSKDERIKHVYLQKQQVRDSRKLPTVFDGGSSHVIPPKNTNSSNLFTNPPSKKSFFTKIKIISIAVLTIILALIGLIIFYPNNNESDSIDANEITKYVQGTELYLSRLMAYKDIWGYHLITQNANENDLLNDLLTLFGRDKHSQSLSGNKIFQLLDSAIMIRNMIDAYEFGKLKNQHYYPDQKQFKYAVEKIDSASYTDLEYHLSNISSLSLNEITKQINAFLASIQTSKEQSKAKKDEENLDQEKQQTSFKPKKNKQSATQPSEKTDEIIEYLRGNELDKEKLAEFKETKGISKDLKESIQLCLDFWDLDDSGSGKNKKTYCNLRIKVIANDYLKDSKLRVFLDEVCNHSPETPYSIQNKKKGLAKC